MQLQVNTNSLSRELVVYKSNLWILIFQLPCSKTIKAHFKFLQPEHFATWYIIFRIILFRTLSSISLSGKPHNLARFKNCICLSELMLNQSLDGIRRKAFFNIFLQLFTNYQWQDIFVRFGLQTAALLIFWCSTLTFSKYQK